jgi:hypothetical protein
MEPRTVFPRSDKGYITDELALDWLHYFDTWTKTRANCEPQFLFLDGHRIHYSLAFVRYAHQKDILIVSYASHSTHLLQPLDLVLFCPLQKAYSKAAADYTRTSCCGVTKKDFWRFYYFAMKEAYTAENIESAWRTSGIFPLNSAPMGYKYRIMYDRHIWTLARSYVIVRGTAVARRTF